MRAVILTAGEAARLRGWTVGRPKGMLPLANRTILEHLVEGLRQAGVRQVTMVVGHGAESVMSLFGDGGRYDVAVAYARQEKLTGTLDALRLGAATAPDEELLVVPGDNFVASQGFAALLEQDGETWETEIFERDLVSVPPGIYRGLLNHGQEEALMCVMLGATKPQTPTYPSDHPLAKVKR